MGQGEEEWFFGRELRRNSHPARLHAAGPRLQEPHRTPADRIRLRGARVHRRDKAGTRTEITGPGNQESPPYAGCVRGFFSFSPQRLATGELHQLFVAAMISGALAELEQWLDARHGPGCFASTFRAPAWNPAAGPRELAARKNAVISRALSCAPSRC